MVGLVSSRRPFFETTAMTAINPIVPATKSAEYWRS